MVERGAMGLPGRRIARHVLPAAAVALLLCGGAVAADAPVCAVAGVCGDLNASGTLTASDALVLLQAAVGQPTPVSCLCEDTTAIAPNVANPIVSTQDGGDLAKFRLHAGFPLLADKGQQWQMVSASPVGGITADGLYSGGETEGQDLVSVTSTADPGVTGELTVTVATLDRFLVYQTNSNGDAVYNGGSRPQFAIGAGVAMAAVADYHHNNGEGTPSAGKIGLKNLDTGRMYGPWQAFGQGDPFLILWMVNLGGLVLPAGNYEVVDSEPATWSQNGGTGGAGMAWLYSWNLE